jgi:hypothetical protein
MVALPAIVLATTFSSAPIHTPFRYVETFLYTFPLLEADLSRLS